MTAVARADWAKPVIGDGLLHPVALVAIAVLLINDHFLKVAYPGIVSGKLSDFAGLIFFPMFLTGAYELVAALAGNHTLANRRVLLMAVLSTGVLFSAIKTVPEANAFLAQVLGFGQWVLTSSAALLTMAPIHSPSPTAITLDPSDLVALPSLVVAYVIGTRSHSVHAK